MKIILIIVRPTYLGIARSEFDIATKNSLAKLSLQCSEFSSFYKFV